MLKPLDRTIEILIAVIAVALLVTAFGQVVARFVFNRPFTWVLELDVLLLVWLTMLSGYIGVRRNLHWLPFGDLAALPPMPAVDLLVCSDVMHYLSDAELKRGLKEFARLCDGVAFLEVFAAGDEIIGDLHGLHRRPADWYRRAFSEAGFVFAGSHTWLSRPLARSATALELP